MRDPIRDAERYADQRDDRLSHIDSSTPASEVKRCAACGIPTDSPAPECPLCMWLHIAALRTALMDIAAIERPSHDHYDDPRECAYCRAFALLDLPGERGGDDERA